ncbi:Sodium channel protein type 4 subunit alpha A (Voltage-gated sodium channel subunit alpha Nav1.4a) [Durusdinium trenchii]|uniref:Sodium channel protein type 4 subunit alpha A (Voltage-gated sodium channel subunit alpha Nav1.4a) n=1 Tax=Durusdinium trenchii TaxID=1381693 RepID=A0ABP0IK68_9DINO
MADEFMKDVREEEEEDYLAEDGEAAKSIRARARWLLSQQWFDMMIGACIILNSIIIGIQADWNVRNISVPEPEGFGVSEKIFAVIFTGELLLRIVGLGFRRFYCGPDWKWALFDTVVVSLQLFDEIITLAVGDDSAAGSQGNLGFMRVVRVLRLLRILRLVRILQFVNELRTMVMSVASSMRSLVWTLVLMLLMMYIIGVYLCQMIADSGAEDATILTKDLVDFYGNLPRAVLSLYQAMTGGVDWNDLSLPLEPISPIMSLIFALYIAFAVLAMMNVVTGVFVESALGSAREDRTKRRSGHPCSAEDLQHGRSKQEWCSQLE